MTVCLRELFDIRRPAKVRFAAAILLTAVSTLAFAQDPNPAPKVPKGDPAMIAAFAKAAVSLDEFFAKWRNPPPGAEGFSVKIGLMDAVGAPGYAIVRPGSFPPNFVEWFWTRDLRADGAGFVAELGNAPEDLRDVSMGQTIHFTRQDIGDWMYFQNGKIIGNATACPALAHASTEERRQMKEQYGLVCE
ncbi:MAG TPA: DUF2314 domain-containing protein [Roseiarcus sp.]|nr:DUF2314 domain-containing protein [Roseiarcus sp.]